MLDPQPLTPAPTSPDAFDHDLAVNRAKRSFGHLGCDVRPLFTALPAGHNRKRNVGAEADHLVNIASPPPSRHRLRFAKLSLDF
jgi:hypothetical protein